MATSQERSALWAAYGDAIGFITELRNAEGVKRKISSAKVSRPVAWERRVGGKFGASVTLPEGCYSDDTQLRLATCRAIRGDGTFDVEAFAKVELPVWLSYYLGAGRGTMAAARHLERRDVAWYTNFYEEKGASYLLSGGNGAAMRVQPHVWADRSLAARAYRLDVLRNALTTHGHPRGFLGALFHADCLAYVREHSRLPGPDVWMEICEAFRQTAALVLSDDNLARVWLPTWEAKAKSTLRQEIERVREEHAADIRLVSSQLELREPESAYADVVRRIGGLAPETSGSGTKTALLAAVVAFLFRNSGANDALGAAANQLGSDTDTIASMAGALAGLLERSSPHVAPADAEYLAREANRLSEIAQSKHQPSFSYPDLLHWRVPKTSADVVGLAGDDTVVAGLGTATPVSEPTRMPKQDGIVWQWMRLEFGQTVLAKRRIALPRIPQNAWPAIQGDRNGGATSRLNEERNRSPSLRPNPMHVRQEVRPMHQTNLFGSPTPEGGPQVVRRRLSDLTTEVIESGFDPVLLGKNLLWILDHSQNPIEAAVAYSAIIAKARAALPENQRRRRPGES